MDSVAEFISRIHYACREGYYHHMQNTAEDAFERFPNDTIFKYYHAIAILFQKQNSDALRDLQSLQAETPVKLGACLASLVAHRSFTRIDKEAVVSLEARVRDGRKTATPNELYYAGLFLSLCNKPEKSKEYLDRAIKQSNHLYDAISCRGWVEMKLALKDKGQKQPSEYFEMVLSGERKHLDALLGLANYYEMCHQFEASMEKLNQILAFQPNWVPALTEKMKIALCLQDWDQAVDIATRVLSADDKNLEAARLKILYSLCREGNIDFVVRSLEHFFDHCKYQERNNAKYFIENARMFSQLASYDQGILAQSIKYARFAAELESENAEYLADVGRIYLYMGDHKQAYQEFRSATNLDNTSMSALYGLISCQLAEGNVEMASQQLDFLRELATSIETPSELSYLTAVVAKRRNQSAETILKYLNEALDAHFVKMRGFAFNVAYLKVINPDLVLNIVREYLQFAPQEPPGLGMQPPVVIKQGAMILETIMKVCPSHRDALFISGHISYLSGDLRAATSILNRILKIDSSMMEAHLLMAQVQIAQNEHLLASQTLENGLASNFKVREHPKYHLLLAKVQKHNGEMEKALVTLEGALNMLKSSKKQISETRGNPVEFGLSDKMSLYMELMTSLRAANKPEEANSVMQDALVEFKGTHLEGRISLAQAEEMVDKGEVDKALSLLKAVQPNQNHYIEAKRLMSEIYLNIRFDSKLFTMCFVDIVNHNSNPQNLIMLADAYMTIQEPDKAIEIYEVALAKNPRDATLASKMGQALVLTHQFSKAINYYKEAVKTDDNFTLRFDLATLHLKLKQWDKAEKTIQQALNELRDNSLNGLLTEVKLLVLLAKVQQGAGNTSLAQQSLVRSKDSQNRALKRVLLEQPSIVMAQKAQFCSICRLLGEVAEKQSEIEFAIRSLKEALECSPEDPQCLITLAKLYMRAGDHIHCQQTCQQLLKIKSESAEASVMLGELFLRKFDFQSASFHFQQFLGSFSELVFPFQFTNV